MLKQWSVIVTDDVPDTKNQAGQGILAGTLILPY